MTINEHTTDQDGFDYMANTGREECDRDMIGIVLALAITAFITFCQYVGLL
ncbi:hypothetical protein [Desulfoplanes formicivorans]|uniref:Uncharacterized protein n=1 Tax=Desulfoplanes formicivorans TaxID=1592317 RepID=A0A194AJL7_9BACT|nr:hypothetical protein [Desulfoplanes formicivorans]GAU09513.1 hypothetical protein DPF_2240 [Desulfoplanes formicivorans]